MASRTPVVALVALAAAVLLSTAPLAAQAGGTPAADAPGGYTYTVTTQGISGDSASAALVRRIRADLAALRQAQDAYYAAHHSYAADLAVLRADFRTHSGAELVLRNVTVRGWEALATHPALAGGSLQATVVMSAEATGAGR
jgi:hypothetical protein